MKKYLILMVLLISISNKTILHAEDNFMLKLSLFTRSLDINISEKDQDTGKEDELNYSPDFIYYLGISAVYNNFGFDFSKSINRSEFNLEIIDIQTSYYGSRTLTDLHFQKYKGYYLEEENNKFYSDLKAKSAGINFLFFSSQFPYKEIVESTKKITKADECFFVQLSLDYFEFSNTSSIIPENIINQGKFKQLAGLKSAKLISGGIGVGTPIYQPLFSDFYILCLIGASWTPGYLEFETESKKVKEFSYYSCKANLKVNIGYNSEKYFIGCNAYVDGSVMALSKEIDLWKFTLNFGIFSGIRF